MYETYRKVYYPFMYVYSILYALCIITAQIAELFLCVELIFVFLFLYLLSSYSSSYASSKCVSAIHYAPTTLTMTTSKYFFNSLFAIFIFVVQGWRSMTLYYLFFFLLLFAPQFPMYWSFSNGPNYDFFFSRLLLFFPFERTLHNAIQSMRLCVCSMHKTKNNIRQESSSRVGRRRMVNNQSTNKQSAEVRKWW